MISEIPQDHPRASLESPNAKKRHYLPAGHIGLFSIDTREQRLRRRQVYVLRHKNEQPFLKKAENVGFRNLFYNYGHEWDWDNYFKGFETHLYEPVDILANNKLKSVSIHDWSQVAAYISSLFTRQPDLEDELNRMGSAKTIDRSKASVGYPLNLQNTSSAILRSRWAFVWNAQDNFILPDRGIVGLFYNHWHSYAYHIPLRRNFAILLGTGPFKKQMKFQNDNWYIEIDKFNLLSQEVENMNKLAYLASREESYGANANDLIMARNSTNNTPQEVQKIAQAYQGAQLLGLSRQERMKDNLLLFKALALRSPVDDDPTELFI